MKKIIFLALLCICCNEKPKLDDYCVTKIEYSPQLKMMVPQGAIMVYIEDKNHILRDKCPLDKLTKVIFYSIKENSDCDFHLIKYQVEPFKIENNIIHLTILTARFWPDIYINGVRSENKWTPQQIQKVLKGDIGLVFEKDTVRVKACNNEQFIMHEN
ncbi:hypothetical protein [Flavobacterium aestivum]|uniref:hypothetical protein n=1 Tax=Flavobacterium aestivum TaxID=3003257 RepID=UPI0022861FDB|nr:hypothetical protein [Flavobacterium aestivum]